MIWWKQSGRRHYSWQYNLQFANSFVVDNNFRQPLIKGTRPPVLMHISAEVFLRTADCWQFEFYWLMALKPAPAAFSLYDHGAATPPGVGFRPHPYPIWFNTCWSGCCRVQSCVLPSSTKTIAITEGMQARPRWSSRVNNRNISKCYMLPRQECVFYYSLK